MKIIARFLIALTLLLLTLAASAQDAVTLRFTVWIPADAAQMETLNAIAAAYSEQNPNVTVQFDFIPFGDYESVLTLQLSGSNPPDAGWLVERSAPTFIGAGVVADLAPVLTADADYDFADFAASAMGLWQEGESIYGIPFSNSPFVFIYNRTLFEEAGVATPDALLADDAWTWEAVAEAADAIEAATDAYGFQSNDAGLYTGNFWITLVPLLRAYGGDAWDAENVCQFNSEGSVAALTLLHQMIFTDESAVPPGTEVDFFAGGAAMTLGQLSRVARLAEATFEWDIAPLPAGSAGSPAVIGQAAIAVFNNSRNRDRAIDFVKFMTAQSGVAQLARFFPPARSSVIESEAFYAANPLIAPEQIEGVVAQAILNGQVLPAHPNFPSIELTVRPLLDTLWTPDADVQAITDSICGAIQPLLDQ